MRVSLPKSFLLCFIIFFISTICLLTQTPVESAPSTKKTQQRGTEEPKGGGGRFKAAARNESAKNDKRRKLSNFKNSAGKNVANDEEGDEFFIDFVMLTYEDIDHGAIYYHFGVCYDDAELFDEYCHMDKVSEPINATFSEEELWSATMDVEGIVDSKGKMLVEVGDSVEICLNNEIYCDRTLTGSTASIQKVAKALKAKYRYDRGWYTNGACENEHFWKKRKPLGLKLTGLNNTFEFNGHDLALYSHDNICELGILDWNDAKDNKIGLSLPVFSNYCIFFDLFLGQVAFAPKKVENTSELKFISC